MPTWTRSHLWQPIRLCDRCTNAQRTDKNRYRMHFAFRLYKRISYPHLIVMYVLLLRHIFIEPRIQWIIITTKVDIEIQRNRNCIFSDENCYGRCLWKCIRVFVFHYWIKLVPISHCLSRGKNNNTCRMAIEINICDTLWHLKQNII